MFILKSIKSQTTNPDTTIFVVVNILDDTTNITSTANSTFPAGTSVPVATAYFQAYVDGLNTPPPPPPQDPDTTKQSILDLLNLAQTTYGQLTTLQSQLTAITTQLISAINAAVVKRAGS